MALDIPDPIFCPCGAQITSNPTKSMIFTRIYCDVCEERKLFRLIQAHRCDECNYTFWCAKCGPEVSFCPETPKLCGVCYNHCGCNQCRDNGRIGGRFLQRNEDANDHDDGFERI